MLPASREGEVHREAIASTVKPEGSLHQKNDDLQWRRDAVFKRRQENNEGWLEIKEKQQELKEMQK